MVIENIFQPVERRKKRIINFSYYHRKVGWPRNKETKEQEINKPQNIPYEGVPVCNNMTLHEINHMLEKQVPMKKTFLKQYETSNWKITCGSLKGLPTLNKRWGEAISPYSSSEGVRRS